MKITVIGANGMLAKDLIPVLIAGGHSVTPLTRADLDITVEKSVTDCRYLSKKNADWVINCAAYTAVDLAETEPEIARDVNEEGVLNLASKLMGGPRLLHVSTDFVFDGTATEPIPETAPTNPLGVYGETKLAGEHYVEALLDDGIIFRTSWLYGSQGKSFPRTMINAWEAGRNLRVISDQIGCPTYTVDLAEAIRQAVEKGIPTGVYHATGKDPMSWHEFALLAIKTWRKDDRPVEIEPIPTSAYPTPAARPAYSVLDTGKLSKSGIAPWQDTDNCLRDFCSKLTL